jgi:VIT1/CCC1 family predicted Fe2+/Mn2+ transporter
VSFGLTTAVITSLGMLVGMYSATSSKLAVIAGIVVMAVADGLSDAVSLHTAEESEVDESGSKHTTKEIWLTTFLAFISVSGFTLTFAIPVQLFPIETAITVAMAWGILLLVVLNFYIARIRKEEPAKLILEHILLQQLSPSFRI